MTELSRPLNVLYAAPELAGDEDIRIMVKHIKELEAQLEANTTLYKNLVIRYEQLEAQLDEANQRADKAAKDGWLKTAETQLARAKKAEAQLAELKKLLTIGCEDMNDQSPNRTCGLADKYDEHIKELEAQLAEKRLQHSPQWRLSAEFLAPQQKIVELEAQLDKFRTMYIPSCKHEVRHRINEILGDK